MTEQQAKQLADECDSLVRDDTRVTPFYDNIRKTWGVKLITGDWQSVFLEQIPPSHMKAIHLGR